MWPSSVELELHTATTHLGVCVQLIDEQGVNRTPKPLVAIVTSAALRQARGIATEESVMGSETSEAMLGDMLSSTTFSRGWFDSGTATPQEGEADFQRKLGLNAYQMAPAYAVYE